MLDVLGNSMRANKDDYMQERDSSSLRYFGFEVAWSGTSWFGVDKEGQVWQAFTESDDSLLHFRKYYASKGTSGGYVMTQAEFLKTFKVMHD